MESAQVTQVTNRVARQLTWVQTRFHVKPCASRSDIDIVMLSASTPESERRSIPPHSLTSMGRHILMLGGGAHGRPDGARSSSIRSRRRPLEAMGRCSLMQ